MNKMQWQVRYFKEKLNGTDDRWVVAGLISEEYGELLSSICRSDELTPEIIDGMCDLIYVIFYAAERYGIDLEPYFDEVQRTNMLKERGTGAHKIKKPEGWKPPQIAQMLAEGIGRV